MDGGVVGGEGGWFVSIIDKLVGMEKMATGSATCAFFTDIGRISGNVEDNIAVMILEWGIGVGCRAM